MSQQVVIAGPALPQDLTEISTTVKFGALTVDTDTLFVDSVNNRVGIGTSSPEHALHIVNGKVLLSNTQSIMWDNAAGIPKTVMRVDSSDAVSIRGAGGVKALDIESSTGASLMVIKDSGNVGINTTSPDRLLHAEVSDAITSAVTPAMRLSHISTGTVANGFGTSLEFELEGADTTNLVAGEVACLWDDSATGTEDSQLSLRVSVAGAVASEIARFDASAVAGETRFMIYDVDNATLERVTVGAADSGGTGFKVLRIPN